MALILGTPGDDVLIGGAGNDTIDGLGGNDVLAGGEGNDSLYGGTGADVLYSGTGSDTLAGGPGDDYYVVTDSAAVLQEASSDGVDTAYATVDFALADNMDILVLGETARAGTGNSLGNVLYGNSVDNVLSGMDGIDVLFGNEGNDTLDGGAGNDVLDGGTGNDSLFGGAGTDVLYSGIGGDTLAGGTGDDYYVVNDAAVVLQEAADAGADTAYSTVNFTLADNMETLVLGETAVTGTGNSLDNTLLGNSLGNIMYGLGGNDFLYGGVGGDTLFGGTGNDYYVAEDTGTVLREAAAEGTDTAYATVDYTLGDNVETLVLGGAVTRGTGSAQDNVLFGNAAGNVLSGMGGHDVLFGNEGDDTLDGGAGDDVLTGGAGNDSLFGGAGNDILYSGIGGDTLEGGTGDDYYVVDDSAAVIQEASGEGTDKAYATVDFTLADNVENLDLGGTAVAGTGSAQDNVLFGNAAGNLLSGMSGSDVLIGNEGNDTLDGGAGADVLYGGDGNDVFIGGSGNDAFIGGEGEDHYLFSGNFGQDVIEGDGQNANLNDIVHFEGLTSTQIAAEQSGNDLVLTYDTETRVTLRDWFLDGNTALNQFYFGDEKYSLSENMEWLGSMGNLVFGGSGDDTLVGGTGRDQLLGDAGNDVLLGFAGNDMLDGGADNDNLDGGAGNDTLIGGAGNDLLYGNAGADVLFFDAQSDNDFALADRADILHIDKPMGSADFGLGISGDHFCFFLGEDGSTDLTESITMANWMLPAAGGDYPNRLAVLEFNDGNRFYVEGFGGNGNDTLSAPDASGYWVEGYGGNDLLQGGSGNDYLTDMGTDLGNDTLNGGLGNDVLFGGVGSDIYLFDGIAGWGNDVIAAAKWNDDTAFANANDLAVISGVGHGAVTASLSGDDLLLSCGSDTITVEWWAVGEDYRLNQFQFSDGNYALDGGLAWRAL